jgi:broad specificity phosphatase PhoE
MLELCSLGSIKIYHAVHPTEAERNMVVDSQREIWLVWHGETSWSQSGAHTSISDIPLTVGGEESARRLRSYLSGIPFALVLSSPRKRAYDTAVLTRFSANIHVDADLAEWDYGEYEGRTTSEIRVTKPSWTVWDDQIEGGERIEQVRERAMRVIARALNTNGRVVLFSHAHFLRVLAATWLHLHPQNGRCFSMDTGSVSILGHERETPGIRLWNRSFESEGQEDRQ